MLDFLPVLFCEQCKAPATHADRYHKRLRLWCEYHTPWSGHWEDCPVPCRRILLETKVSLWLGDTPNPLPTDSSP